MATHIFIKEILVTLSFNRMAALAALSLTAIAGASAAQAKDYVTTPAAQGRAYSLAVVTNQPAKTIYLAGQTGRFDADGKPITTFDGQARRALQLIDETLKKSGSGIGDVVSMTVFISDVRDGVHFPDIRREFFPDGKFPGSALIAVAGLQSQALIEVQAVAVVDKGK